MNMRYRSKEERKAENAAFEEWARGRMVHSEIAIHPEIRTTRDAPIVDQSESINDIPLDKAGPSRTVYLLCNQHPISIRAIDEEPTISRTNNRIVILHVSLYEWDDGRHALIGLGQCPECLTIHYAIKMIHLPDRGRPPT